MQQANDGSSRRPDPPKMQRLFSEEGDWQIAHGTVAELLSGTLAAPLANGGGPGADAFEAGALGAEEAEAEAQRREIHKQLGAKKRSDRRLSRPAEKVPIAGEMAPLGSRWTAGEGGFVNNGRSVSTSSRLGVQGFNSGNGRYRAATEVDISGVQPEYDIYVVERGDTLPGVALRHDMSVAHLKKINHLFDSRIFQGQELRVAAAVRPEEEQCTPPIYPQLPARVHVELQNFSKTSEHEERDTDSIDLHRPHGQLTTEPIDIPRFMSDVTLLRSNDALKAKAENALQAGDTTIEPKSQWNWKPFFPLLQRNKSLSFAGTPSTTDQAHIENAAPTSGGFWWRRRPGSGDAEEVRPGLFFRQKTAPPPVQPVYTRPNSTTTVKSDLEFIQAEALAKLKDKKRFDEIQYASPARSTILSEDMMQKLHDLTSEDLHANCWNMIFSTEKDGTSLAHFLQLAQGVAPTVIIIETMEQEVFGGVAFTEWGSSFHYFGEGEAFLFKADLAKEVIHPYYWSRKNTMLQYCTSTLMGMGGGNGYFGILFDDSFHRGTSHTCPTFDNEPLASSEDFFINKLEVWTLLSPVKPVYPKRLQST